MQHLYAQVQNSAAETFYDDEPFSRCGRLIGRALSFVWYEKSLTSLDVRLHTLLIKLAVFFTISQLWTGIKVHCAN